MGIEWPDKIFVTGTDTDVGKSLVCALLLMGLKADYWKPIQSGLGPATDTEWLKRITGLPDDHFHPETYRLHHPLSPHAAAELDGVEIRLDRFKPPSPAPGRKLIVEGAGGLMVPLNQTDFMLDLIKHLGLPVLLVARSSLGTINHTVLSLEQMRRHNLSILGVIMNGPNNPGNKKAIEFYGREKVLAEIEPLAQVDAGTLAREYEKIVCSYEVQ